MSFDPKDWTGLDNTNIGEGRILSATTMRALDENLIAAFQGAAGAPRIDGSQGAAITSFDAMGEWYTNAGGVGTYAQCLHVSESDLTLGQTIAGSGLRFANSASNENQGAAASGTWQCMGHVRDSSIPSFRITLFQRIA